MTGRRYSYVPPGGGKSYDWARDHTFVKVSTADTGGAYTRMEDNLKAEFELGLHLHRRYAETFYILDGRVNFYIDGEWMTAEPGSTIHIPPGVAHAVDLPPDGTGRMLMICQPSGFDQYLVELSALSAEQQADEARMEALALKYDIVNLGDVPERT
jgi:quercetin dioxygenase-like cupin family protein